MFISLKITSLRIGRRNDVNHLAKHLKKPLSSGFFVSAGFCSAG
ncbi:MAG: hypothetical protein OFPI_26400 [Osedax symbiont Rs2]|nr:MAG: hypothetical protein OFPI_26400 [Osedax symbiont Rs2]